MPKVKAATIPPKKTATSKAPAATPAAAPKKKMSAYNEFMKSELPKFKAKNPDVGHKEAFKQVAQQWKNSSLNPKRV